MVDGAKLLWSKFTAVIGRTLRTNKSVGIRGQILLGLGATILLGFILWKFPQWQVQEDPKLTVKEFLELRNKARGTLAQIIGGLVVLWGLYFTWRRIEVAQEGQITERFTRAINQLGAIDEQGNKKLEIRLGGIYALDRIARDSKKDRWPIIEVLTAYVRENAPWPLKASPQLQDSKLILPVTLRQEGQPPPPLPTDVQAILTVLGRRRGTWAQIASNGQPDDCWDGMGENVKPRLY